MSSLPIGMIIEALVAVLLVVTICYCWVLNSRLQRLRADEQTLRATISELMTATEIAERAILGLKTTANQVDQSLGTRLQNAEKMSQLLSEQVGEGAKIFDRISQIAEAASASSVQRAPMPQVEEPLRQPVRPPETHAQPHTPILEPARVRAPSRTDDIRSAAAEATARLERFRQRSEGAVA